MSISRDELFAFAGLVRWLVRLDGQFTKDESAAIERVSAEILGSVEGGPEAGPYRQPDKDATPNVDIDIWPLIDRAGEEIKDEDALRVVARGVTRPEARQAIFEALYEVAAADVIAKQEWPFLEWLQKEWAISTES